MANNQKNSSGKGKQALAVAGGFAALAAAAAGVYYMTGKNSGNRKKVSKWISNMQKDVVAELDKVGKASQAAYNKAVDTVSKNYNKLGEIDKGELMAAAMELKSSWNAIKSEMAGVGNVVKKIAPKSAQTTAKNLMSRATSMMDSKSGGAKKQASTTPAKKASGSTKNGRTNSSTKSSGNSSGKNS